MENISKGLPNAEASFVAEIAVRSLLYEVSVSPKPGLVDRFDNGAHNDMNFFIYIDSSVALSEYFRAAFLMGSSMAAYPPEGMFPKLQKLGLQAEQRMYQATKGVNTHKGIIFTLGLLCGGLGYLSAAKSANNEHHLLTVCGQIAGPAMQAALRSIQTTNAATGGERLYVASGQTGARGEAAAGYPSIRNYGLPTLRKALQQGYSINDAGILVLLKLLCCVEDSNIFSRAGLEKQRELACWAQNIAKKDCLDIKEVQNLNLYCIREHISPGGCADLLAATFFLYFYYDEMGNGVASPGISLQSS